MTSPHLHSIRHFLDFPIPQSWSCANFLTFEAPGTQLAVHRWFQTRCCLHCSALHCRNRVGITTTMTKNLVLNFSSKVTPWCDIYWVTSQSDSLFFRSIEEHTKKLLKWLWLGKKTASGKFCMCQHTWERATFSDEPISASIQWWSTFSNDTLKSILIRASSMYHSS